MIGYGTLATPSRRLGSAIFPQAAPLRDEVLGWRQSERGIELLVRMGGTLHCKPLAELPLAMQELVNQSRTQEPLKGAAGGNWMTAGGSA
jgi:hypothetical protein